MEEVLEQPKTTTSAKKRGFHLLCLFATIILKIIPIFCFVLSKNPVLKNQWLDMIYRGNFDTTQVIVFAQNILDIVGAYIK